MLGRSFVFRITSPSSTCCFKRCQIQKIHLCYAIVWTPPLKIVTFQLLLTYGGLPEKCQSCPEYYESWPMSIVFRVVYKCGCLCLACHDSEKCWCGFCVELWSERARKYLQIEIFLCRVDSSDLHAFNARSQFARAVQKGESGINLAEAALAIGAEDDALVSHSTVPLPVQSFVKRIRSLSNELARIHLPRLGSDAQPEAQLQVNYLQSCALDSLLPEYLWSAWIDQAKENMVCTCQAEYSEKTLQLVRKIDMQTRISFRPSSCCHCDDQLMFLVSISTH